MSGRKPRSGRKASPGAILSDPLFAELRALFYRFLEAPLEGRPHAESAAIAATAGVLAPLIRTLEAWEAEEIEGIDAVVTFVPPTPGNSHSGRLGLRVSQVEGPKNAVDMLRPEERRRMFRVVGAAQRGGAR